MGQLKEAIEEDPSQTTSNLANRLNESEFKYLWGPKKRNEWDAVYSENLVVLHPIKISHFKDVTFRKRFCRTVLETFWSNLLDIRRNDIEDIRDSHCDARDLTCTLSAGSRSARNGSGEVLHHSYSAMHHPFEAHLNLMQYASRFELLKTFTISARRLLKRPTQFPATRALSRKSWKKMSSDQVLESAQENKPSASDHRRVGCDQQLFFFHPLSPGSVFWYPKGAHIYNKLIDFIRNEYRKRGYKEVITPNMCNCKLWQTSGHWEHYCDHMFKFKLDNEQFGLKPMNCPGHCLMYSHEPHTYNQLPIRIADFGVLHRNEMSGSLTGLTRVRRFQQDDAHIFCRKDQIGDEIRGCLEFLTYCYEVVFGFTFKLNLATRPEKFLGEISAWNEAEAALNVALDDCGKPWELKEGDGAFYGPKIDITIKDSLGRNHQCATIQLDFQLPQRFDLSYFDENGEKQRPVIIHRAILGSVERMIAILAESCGGKWPFWLSPRQAKIIAIHESVNPYAREVKNSLYGKGFEVEFDECCSDTLAKQIRKAAQAQFNFILVVGPKEMRNGTVNVRTRENESHGEVHLDELIQIFRRLESEYVRNVECDVFAF
ncbi:hypothetical protein Y032_0101g3347 [Ancylostoma ceylanicum]|nr:hypothetical protein Y032_0101g3347 [Ancylostoma ceylanicum]